VRQAELSDDCRIIYIYIVVGGMLLSLPSSRSFRSSILAPPHLARLEHSHLDELGPEDPVTSLKVNLPLVLVCHALRVKLADVKPPHGSVATGGVEGSEDVRHVVPCVGEDDSTSRVLVPVRHVIDLVLVDNPRILG